MVQLPIIGQALHYYNTANVQFSHFTFLQYKYHYSWNPATNPDVPGIKISHS
jgi:hypothetical protein